MFKSKWYVCPHFNNKHIFPGDFHADFTGYTSSRGPGAGLPQTHQLGGSGGGHGGRGGRSKWAYYSAYSYDSLYFPNQMGSGGGTGKDGPGGRGGGGYTQQDSADP